MSYRAGAGCALILCLGLATTLAWSMVGTPGQASVNDSGEAVYAVPLRIPPGTAGMEPKLSLIYTSRGGNGAFGQGVSLSGVSAITRCPQTRAQDGTPYNGAIRYDGNDRLCLDGQRLVAVVGAYGSDGTEYRTEIDTFTRIRGLGRFADPGGAWFEVRTPDGIVRHYGSSTDSRILAQGKSVTAAWALKTVTDRNGNALSWTWGQDTANGFWWPAAIDYTSHASGTPPFARVVFEAEGRPDQVPRYLAGSKYQTSVRIKKIATYLEGGLVREYRLTYNQSPVSGVSRLTQLTECNPADGCLQPTRLTWGSSGTTPLRYTFQTPRSGAPASMSGMVDVDCLSSGRCLFLDINGDGRTESLMIWNRVGQIGNFNASLGNFEFTGVTLPPSGYASLNRFFAMDVNGDGLGDIVLRGEGGTLSTWLSNGSGFYQGGEIYNEMFKDGVNWRDECEGCGGYEYMNTELNRFFVMDVNGDGRTDLVHRDKQEYLDTWLSNGATFVHGGRMRNPFRDAKGEFKNIPESGWPDNFWNAPGRFFITDVNGDGMSDLVVLEWDGGRFSVWLSNGSSFTWSSTTSFSTFPGETVVYDDGYPTTKYDVPAFTLVPADVNGDGRVDLVGWGNNLTVWLGDGVSFILSSSTYAGQNSHAFPMDINGDGRTDMLLRDQSGVLSSWISTGVGFEKRGEDLTGQSDNYYASDDWVGYEGGGRYFVMDLEGKGRASLVSRGMQGKLTAMRLMGMPEAADMVKEVEDGLGTRFVFGYQSISQQGGIYGKGGPLPYPLMRVQSPMYVVSRIETVVPESATHPVETFRYSDLRAEVGTGRGSLGFGAVLRTLSPQGRTTVSTYRQDFPYAGRLNSRQVEHYSETNDENVETEAIYNTYGCRRLSYGAQPAVAEGDCTVGAGRNYFVFQKQSSKSGDDLLGGQMPSATTVNLYDCETPGAICFGNLKQTSVTTPDGHSKTISFDYLNDLTRWHFGLPIRMTTDGTAPALSGLSAASVTQPPPTPAPPPAQQTNACTANLAACLQPILGLLLED